MKVTQEKLPASQIGLEIEITPEMSKAAYEKVIREFTHSMNIPGFRKGKVPRQVLMLD
jgi:trigger factor